MLVDGKVAGAEALTSKEYSRLPRYVCVVSELHCVIGEYSLVLARDA